MNCSQNDVLNIKGLSLSYPKNKEWILDGLNLKIVSGERLALIGSSGSGKSTVAKLLLQILPEGTICKGEVWLHGQDLWNWAPDDFHKLRGELIGLVFQDPGSRLNPLLTIGKHLIDPLQAPGRRFVTTYCDSDGLYEGHER